MTGNAEAPSRGEVRAVLAQYRLPGFPRVVGRLPGGHLSLRVQAGESEYVLRQFTPYADAAAVRAQCLLMDFLRRGGLRVVTPLRTKEEEGFVAEGERLWALFARSPGRRGRPDSPQDRATLVSLQARWVVAAERVRTAPEWEVVVRLAQRFRRSTSWVWTVPLDRVPQFALEQRVVDTARASLRAAEKDTLFSVVDVLEGALGHLQELLSRQGVARLPHTVTHGDFVLRHLLITERAATVAGLDGYSYEPRAADFARSLSRWQRKAPESELRSLAGLFQSRAGLAPEELEIIPLLICAYELYYAVMHMLLLLEAREEADRARTLAALQEEAQAIARYHKERSRLLALLPRAAP